MTSLQWETGMETEDSNSLPFLVVLVKRKVMAHWAYSLQETHTYRSLTIVEELLPPQW